MPGRISVTGWDNNPLGGWLSPALTTVDVDYEDLGRLEMQRLLDVIQGNEQPAPAHTLARPVWRETTGPVDA